MKNFEMQCPIDGTAALQPEFGSAPASAGTVVEFPVRSPHPFRTAPVGGRRAVRLAAAPAALPHDAATGRRRQGEMMRCLRYGTVQGQAYGCVKPWQAALAGSLFSAFALATLLAGF